MKKHSMQLASEIKVSEDLAGERNLSRLLPKQITMQANFSLDYFSSFISESISSGKVFEHGRVEDTVSKAQSIGLIKQGDGGISLGSYVSMTALAEAIQVKTYIESGVHKGSSLHAICSQPSVNRIYLLDPNLEKLEFEPEVPTTKLDDLDFAFWSPPQDFIADESLVFFDDHINTANRILQASKRE